MQGFKIKSLWQKNYLLIYVYSYYILVCVSSSLIYGKDIFFTKNIVADKSHEAEYFALSTSHLTVAFLVLLLGCYLSLTVHIVELVYGRSLGHTKYSDL